MFRSRPNSASLAACIRIYSRRVGILFLSAMFKRPTATAKQPILKPLLAAAILLPSVGLAQSGLQGEAEITDLARVDHIYLNNKRDEIKDLSFKQLDKILRGDKRDLPALQALLDQQLVAPAEEQLLISMGVILGDIYVSELDLEWKNYTDNLGKSRAVCMTTADYCLFPLTMISKRVKRGAKVNIVELYQKGVDHLEPHRPKLPYSADED